MNVLDRLNDDFPHGLPAGFDQGCRGAGECANQGTELPICRDAWIRYRSDWTFKKRVDRGLSPAEILVEERAEAQVQRAIVVEARQAAAVKADQVRHTAEDRARAREERAAARAARERVKLERAAAKAEQVRVAAAKVSTMIAVPIGDVAGARAVLKDARAIVRALAHVDDQALLERAVQRVFAAEQVLSGMLADRARNRETVRDRSRAEARTKSVPRPREVKPHGTNASFARGCREPQGCPNFGTSEPTCYDANRDYYRAYMARRRRGVILAKHHGTPYGYQLGCRDRGACPAIPSCADASLVEEARRRRKRGTPERALMVPADPVRAHVRALMSAGIPYLTVAERAGVSKSSTQTLLYGRSGSRKGSLPKFISAKNAERLMKVTP